MTTQEISPLTMQEKLRQWREQKQKLSKIPGSMDQIRTKPRNHSMSSTNSVTSVTSSVDEKENENGLDCVSKKRKLNMSTTSNTNRSSQKESTHANCVSATQIQVCEFICAGGGSCNS